MPERARRSPARCYLVCASQRSGTTLLCHALSDTGVAGRPDEYFLAVDPKEAARWPAWEHGPFGISHGARDREHYVEIVYRLGTTPNGVFGAKLMWNNLPWAVAKFQEMPRFRGLDRAGVLHAAFPELRVIHVVRHDRVRQAVSWARMAQDGVWVVSDTEPARPAGRPEYDFELIDALAGLIAESERGWRQLFDELGVTPHEVAYEDLVAEAGYERTVLGALQHLGVDTSEIVVPPPRTHRQADELNEAWVDRYRSDRAGVARMRRRPPG
jgi:LPS sulfotransferase NodH